MRGYRKNKFRYLFFIGVLIASLAGMACSCSTTKRLPPGKETIYIHTTDSVFFHDTLLLAPVPQESTEQKVADTDTSRLSTSVAESEAWVKDGELHHTLRNKNVEIPVPATLKNYLHSETREVVRTVFQEVEKPLTRMQKLLISGGQAFIVVIVFFLGRLIYLCRRKRV